MWENFHRRATSSEQRDLTACNGTLQRAASNVQRSCEMPGRQQANGEVSTQVRPAGPPVANVGTLTTLEGFTRRQDIPRNGHQFAFGNPRKWIPPNCSPRGGVSCRSIRPANGVRGGTWSAWSVCEWRRRAQIRYALRHFGYRPQPVHSYSCSAARIEASRSRVSGVEPAMVRYRLGCRRGGNGRRGGPANLWASARVSSTLTAGTAAPVG